MGEHIDKITGKINPTVGAMTSDAGSGREGERDEAKGGVQGAIMDVKSATKEAKTPVKLVVR